MHIILFAIIGATIDAGAWYWVFFGAFCVYKYLKLVLNFAKFMEQGGNDKK